MQHLKREFQVPENVLPPKFQLFQRVVYTPKTGKPQEGVIVGMEYVTLFTALVHSYDGFGWVYRLDFYFNAPFEKALGCHETGDDFDEDELQPIPEEAAVAV